LTHVLFRYLFALCSLVSLSSAIAQPLSQAISSPINIEQAADEKAEKQSFVKRLITKFSFHNAPPQTSTTQEISSVESSSDAVFLFEVGNQYLTSLESDFSRLIQLQWQKLQIAAANIHHHFIKQRFTYFRHYSAISHLG